MAFLDVARFFPSLSVHRDKLSSSPSPPSKISLNRDWHFYLWKSLISPSQSAINRAKIYKNLRRISHLLNHPATQFTVGDDQIREGSVCQCCAPLRENPPEENIQKEPYSCDLLAPLSAAWDDFGATHAKNSICWKAYNKMMEREEEQKMKGG